MYAFPSDSYVPRTPRPRPQYREQFYKEFPAAVASGALKYSEDRTLGLEGVGEAIVAVQKGTNKGKKVIVVAEE